MTAVAIGFSTSQKITTLMEYSFREGKPEKIAAVNVAISNPNRRLA